MPLAITYRGQVANNVLYWQTVATHDALLPFPAVSVGRVVLETIHAKLFSFYDQIDIEAILRQWRAARQTAPNSAEDEAVVIAASIATGGSAVKSGRRVGRIASSLRLSELRSLLERRFHCTSRSGKGSKLVFYREGEKQAFVSRHKSNPSIPAVAIQRILKKLGIGVDEWLEVTCR